jgi:hypothetical protein
LFSCTRRFIFALHPVLNPLSNLVFCACKANSVLSRVVDLDPDSMTMWIRIRIGNPGPDPGARKLRNFSGKNALFSYFLKKFNH